MKERKMLALDIGTSSVRNFLGEYNGRCLKLREISRFYHTPVKTPVGVNWNMLGLYQSLEKMIRQAMDSCRNIESISLDAWGTDAVALDYNGELLTNGIGTQDIRFNGLKEKFFHIIPKHEIYERTGIQFLNWNTLYLLYLISQNKPWLIQAIDCILFTPDYFIYMLTGEKICDYTIASTSQILNPLTYVWDEKLVGATGIPITKLLIPEFGRKVGVTREFGIPFYSGCNHDTAAAVAGTPLQKEDELFLIMGSWIILGTELEQPLITPITRKYNFSNEGGSNKRIRFLKNCTGMWVFQELQRCLEKKGQFLTFEKMAELGVSDEMQVSTIDIDDVRLRSTTDIVSTLRKICLEKKMKIPETTEEIIQCLTNSIAAKISENKKQLEFCTGKKIKVIRAVGGGIQNKKLCQAIANTAECTISAGPIEASGYGNLLTQLVLSNEISNYAEGREIIRSSVSIEIYEPE